MASVSLFSHKAAWVKKFGEPSLPVPTSWLRLLMPWALV